MKKLIALGMIMATAAFGGKAFAGEGGTGHDRQLQELMEWSARAVEQAKKDKKEQQVAGPVAQPTNPVPPYQQYPFGIR